ncbi:MAG: hypothetical protein HOU81_09265 [Hamadaea sp.]|uniref:hypothetical protein n=1 Tax=Hamadaea sp. TaxID=2024425 RepID=UPI0017EF5C6C|nr:hypothetical protein [Hamadaea sp.]NUR70998.1 hypothetical protein [Hamadaea sp.]NUT23679.1 hypothetical protein [Hamadaea sp.]
MSGTQTGDRLRGETPAERGERAEHLGVAPETLPGGHNGNLTYPRAFAGRVAELLK